MQISVHQVLPVMNVKETVMTMINVQDILSAFKEMVMKKFLGVEQEVLKDGIIVIVVLPVFLLYVIHVLQPNI